MTTYQHIDQNDEWIVDDFGSVVGIRARIDGQVSADKNFVFGATDPVTGGIKFLSGSNEVPGESVGNLSILGVKKGGKLVIWGDSTAAQNALNASSAYLGGAFAVLGNYYASNPVDIVAVSGNSGQRTDQIIPSFASQVAGFAPDFVLLTVSTNDLIQGYGPDSALNGVMTMAAMCESIGAIPIMMTIAAGETFANSATLRADWLSFNTALRRLARSLGYPLLDAMYSYLDPTSSIYSPLPGYTDGAVHPYNKGAQAIGQDFAKLLRNLPKRRIHNPVDGVSNICSNAVMSGTSGTLQTGSTGQAPTGTTLQVASASSALVSSVFKRTDGGAGNWWQVSGNMPEGQGVNFILPVRTLAESGVAVGDKVRFVCDVEIDAGHSGVLCVNAGLRFTGGSIGWAYAYSAQSANGTLKPGAHKLQLRVPEIAVPSGTTALGLYVLIVPMPGGGSPSFTARIGSPSGGKI